MDFCVFGACWQVGVRVDDATLLSSVADVGASFERGLDRPGEEGLIRIVADGPLAALPWPLDLSVCEEVHCHANSGLRFFFRDGAMAWESQTRSVDLFLAEVHHAGMTGALAAAFMCALAYRGTPVLHGAALVLDGAAILVLGNSGAGKSTLAAAWLHHGRILTDDLLVASVGESQGSGVVAESFRADAYIRPDAVELLPDDLRASVTRQKMASGVKYRLARGSTNAFVSGAVPVSGLLLLDPTLRANRSEVVPVTQAESLAALIAANAYLSAGWGVAWEALSLASVAFAQSLPAARLRVGRDLMAHPGGEARHIETLVRSALGLLC